MQLSREGIELIKTYEGLRLKAYKCPAKVWTIGYGHTSAAGSPEVKPGMTITADEAETMLIRDLKYYETAVRLAVKRVLPPSQFSALVSFCYNVGPGNFNKSSVLKAVNAKRDDLVPSKLALWNKGDDRVLPGLIKRRAAEAALYMSGKIGEEIHFSTKVEPSRGKPMLASTTGYAAGAVGIASTVSTVAQVSTDLSIIKDNAGPTIFAVVAGVVVLVGLGYIIYERFKKSREDGV